ncbi:transcriptional regulator FilR1 domain-containing protein [Halobacteriaceae archaeon SHR40]|uniref:transcriptional regulator FilR1 domain-containing protein n=1 Tax=Halovenus amylolytica TaxID=2500550 RepID=UPI000FE2F879
MSSDDVGEAAAVLARIVANATDTDLGSLGGETTLFGRETPPMPTDRVPDILAGADALVGVVPRLDQSLLGALRDRETDLTARIVVTGQAREQLTGPTRLAARSILEERDVDLYAHEGDSPVGVLLVDERALVGLFDDRGLAAAMVTDAPAVREWAVETCERYRDASEMLFD